MSEGLGGLRVAPVPGSKAGTTTETSLHENERERE